MKILMVQTFYYYRGGDSTYMLNLSKLLEERGHEVVPFAMRHPQNLPSPYERYFAPEIDFPSLLAEFSPRAAWTVLGRSIHNRQAARSIAALVDEVNPDIAHFHNIHGHLTTSIIGPLRRRDIPIVWTLHDFRQVCPNTSFLSHGEICERCLPNRFYEVLLHRCKKGSVAASLVAMLTMYCERLSRVQYRVQHFITPSRFLKSKLIAGGFDTRRITPIPNFVDLDAYGPGEEKGHFLYIGRLLFEKGLDTLIRAVAALDRGELWIVGEGPVEGELRALVAELGTERVHFKGYLSGDELKRVLSEAQFIVLPSRWYENLPFSIMEAFACSRPVVASDVGGIPEMVDDGVNGYLFPVGDVDALVERLGAMLDDTAGRREMGRRAREKAERLYNREEHYRRIEEIYRRVFDGAR